jgi:hypothetical protein
LEVVVLDFLTDHGDQVEGEAAGDCEARLVDVAISHVPDCGEVGALLGLFFARHLSNLE